MLNLFGKMVRSILSNRRIGALFVFGVLLFSADLNAQTGTCDPAGDFQIDARLYSSPGLWDWFEDATGGNGVIIEDGGTVSSLTTLLQNQTNPTYIARQKLGLVSVFGGKILIDAIFARDQFGGTGHTDPTSYLTASKNGEDPAIWDPGTSNVLGKNDIIDVAGFMFRDGQDLDSDLWFVGMFNMAEPGGVSYMDFEFFVQDVQLLSGPGGISFTSGGPQLGHTAYTFDVPGNITKIGDFIFSVSLLSGGPVVETRLWVSRADWQRLGGPVGGSTPTFQWAGTFDGAFNNAPFGYAGIESLPAAPQNFCGVVNTSPVTAPPWGTRNTKTNVYGTTYQTRSVAEVGINLTAFGMDHASLSGTDPCFFPLNTLMIKTRASASFTAQLKDFAGPYSWGELTASAFADPEPISCDNPFPLVTAFPQRADLTYLWSTLDGNFYNIEPYDASAKGFIVAFDDPCLADPLNITCTYLGTVPGDPWDVQVDKVGTYDVTIILPTDCPIQTASAVVTSDPAFPFFDGPPTYSYTVPCNDDDGTITVTASGATKPYTFTLYEDDVFKEDFTVGITESSHTFTDLEPGDYRVDVKGEFACIETTGPFTIPARIPVVITETITNVDCFGDQTGSISLDITGGNTPLLYEWSNGSTTQSLSNIGAGTYTITVTDADGCETIESYMVSQNTQITATFIKVDDPGNDGDGSAEVFPSGGTPPYSYLWEGPNSFSSTDKAITNLGYGAYTVTVTDDLGCQAVFSTFIFEKEICDDGIDNSGNGLTDCDDPDCEPDPTSPISISPPPICVGEIVTYSVINDPDVNEYIWTVPANATINSGQGTNEIEVIWSDIAGGQICVQARVFDCLSSPVCIETDVVNVPPPATNINID